MFNLTNFSQTDVLNKIIEYMDGSLAQNLQEYQDERNKAIKARDDKIAELEIIGLNAQQADTVQLTMKQKYGEANEEMNKFFITLASGDGMLAKDIDKYFTTKISDDDIEELKSLQLNFLKKAKMKRNVSPYLDRTTKIKAEHDKIKKDFESGHCHGISMLWTYGVHITHEVAKAAELNMGFYLSSKNMDVVELIRKTEEITSEIHEHHSAAIRVQSQARGMIERKKTQKIEREYEDAKDVFFKQLKSLKLSLEEAKSSVIEYIYEEVFNVDGKLKLDIDFEKIKRIMFTLEQDGLVGSEKEIASNMLILWRGVDKVLKLLQINNKDKEKRRKLSKNPKDIPLIEKLKQQKLLLQNEITKKRIQYDSLDYSSIDETTKKRMQYEGLDNNAWFSYCIDSILNWSPGSSKQDNVFETFINNVRYLHRLNLSPEFKKMELEPGEMIKEIKQIDIDVYLSGADTRERQFGISAICVTNDIDYLQEFLTKPENRCKMVNLAIKQHDMSAYCDEDKDGNVTFDDNVKGNVTFFDPNYGNFDFDYFKNTLMPGYEGCSLLCCQIIEPDFRGNPIEEVEINYSRHFQQEDQLYNNVMNVIGSKNFSDDFSYKIIADYYKNKSDLFELRDEEHGTIVRILARMVVLTGHDNVLKRLLEISPEVKTQILEDLTKIDKRGVNPMLYAAIVGCTELFELLFDNLQTSEYELVVKNMLNLKNNKNETLAHYAVLNGKIDVLELLINKLGIGILNEKDNNDENPIHHAANKGHLNLVIQLSSREDVRKDLFIQHNRVGITPIHYLAKLDKDVILSLVKKYGIDILSVKEKQGITPIHLACSAGNTELIKSLLSKYPDLDLSAVRNKHNESPVHYAAVSGCIELMLLLVEKYGVPMLYEKGLKGKTPLHYAAEQGHMPLLDILFRGDDVSLDILTDQDDSGKTIIHYILEHGNVELLEKLIVKAVNAGVDILNQQDEAGKTLMHYLGEKGHTNLLQRLLDKGFLDQDMLIIKDKTDKTPIHYAVEHGGADLLGKLIDKAGIEILNEEDVHGKTPVYYASEHDNTALLEMVLCRKDITAAILNQKDIKGGNLAHWAVLNGREELLKTLLDKDGLSSDFVRQTDHKGKTPMHYLAVSGDTELLKKLIEKFGINILREQDNVGKTPIHHAVKNGHATMLDMLLKTKDVPQDILNIKDTNGETIAHFAAEYGEVQVLNWLAEKSLDFLDKTNNGGQTMAHLAAENGEVQVLNWLADKRLDFLDKTTNGGYTMAHLAAENDKLDVLKWIFTKNSEVLLKKDSDGYTIATIAASSGNLEILEWVFGTNPEILAEKNNDGDTVATIAASNGNLEILEWVFATNREILAEKNNDGYSMAHLAAEHHNLDVLKWVFTKNPDVLFEKNSDGCTIATIAASIGDLEILEWILENWPKFLSATTDDGETIAHLASENAENEVLNWIAKNSPELLFEKDNSGKTIPDDEINDAFENVLNVLPCSTTEECQKILMIATKAVACNANEAVKKSLQRSEISQNKVLLRKLKNLIMARGFAIKRNDLDRLENSLQIKHMIYNLKTVISILKNEEDLSGSRVDTAIGVLNKFSIEHGAIEIGEVTKHGDRVSMGDSVIDYDDVKELFHEIMDNIKKIQDMHHKKSFATCIDRLHLSLTDEQLKLKIQSVREQIESSDFIKKDRG